MRHSLLLAPLCAHIDLMRQTRPDASILPVTPSAKNRKARFGLGRKMFKGALTGVGLFLMVVAVPISWLPGPLGLPVFMVGLVLVLKNARWTKRVFVRLKKRYPNWVMPVRKLLRRNPPFISVLWQMVLRLERLVFGLFKSRTQLGGWRRQYIRNPFFRRKPA